ncbi:MAG: hypothetical protein KDD69_18005, partial [Bdellovibrionales bacterium]|nr:hypothetical protein [Bdellovibrionales bacterium]
PTTEKYWHLMRACYSLLPSRSGWTPFWSPQAKLGALALTVKVFYLPMLSTWAIGNVFYQIDLTSELSQTLAAGTVTFRDVHKYLMALLLLIDVAIFAVGYCVELPQLKNQIRSVEPTLLGWAVCLICYPPFNSVFELFDRPLTDSWTPTSEQWKTPILIVLLVLWTIYVWATVALGWRASNLTNRGIVDRGPYRFVRHPAYVSKVSLWAIECFFFSMRTFYLIALFVLIYSLRAWTEERHLSADPEYLEYKRRVRWRFVPYIY